MASRLLQSGKGEIKMTNNIKLIVLTLLLTFISTSADARIRIQFLNNTDAFHFHAQVYDENFRARFGDFRIEAWNSAGQIYSVNIPAGSCTSTGEWSCVYRDPAARRTKSGLAYFRILYQSGTHGNKIWLESYGDLSSATDPVMSFRIYMDDVLYAYIGNEVFTRTYSGWVGF